MPYTESQKSSLSKLRGKAASYISDQSERAKYLNEQGDVEARHGGTAPDAEYERMQRNAEDTIATEGVKQIAHARSENPTAPSYKHGTDRVPKTGPAILHKDEAVLNKHDADHYRAAKDIMDAAGGAMGGQEKQKKELKEVRTRKGHNGGYIHEHHHTHPDVHPMEEHVSPDQDSMVSHMIEHMGSPASGDTTADAGQGQDLTAAA